MKTVTAVQQIGDIGEQLVGYLLTSRLNVIYRPISKRDTGVDAEIELTRLKENKNYQATGILIKAQVKASTKKKFVKGKLEIQLSNTDKKYLTSDLNLPVILFFADLHNSKHEVYWAEVIPMEIANSNKITIYKKNRLKSETIDSFNKIESYYRSKRFREELINLYEESFNNLKKHILNNSDGMGIAILISEFDDDLTHIDEVHRLSYIKNVKTRDIPIYENIFNDRNKFNKRKSELKKDIDLILKDKGLQNYDHYNLMFN